MIDSIHPVVQTAVAPAAVETAPQGTTAKDHAPAAEGTTAPAGGGSSDPAEAAKPSTRLLIDQDKSTGAFIYRIVDALDGRLLAEIPRESVDQLKGADGYAAGALISTSV